jgi:uncharacterized repeat protein (TIGR03803 family)
MRNSQGDLFGTTLQGGTRELGTFFKLSRGKETVLHIFGEGWNPTGTIVRDSAGNFYGTTNQGGASLAGTIYKMSKTGIVTRLYSFHEYPGQNPYGGLTIDAAGNLYGTTTGGGGAPECECGSVFELTPSNDYIALHRFKGGTDGAIPFSSLLRDSLGNLYGTTLSGGNSGCASFGRTGCGTVFKITAAGAEKVMHRFAGPPNDGANPYAGLVRDKAGNFYGTTSAGGTANQGTVFKIDTAGKETILHNFQGGSDGAQPSASMVLDLAGNLYGTTVAGGGGDPNICQGGCGTVFRLQLATGNESILHSFEFQTEGYNLQNALILGSDGNLYGTATHGGTPTGSGTIFMITP